MTLLYSTIPRIGLRPISEIQDLYDWRGIQWYGADANSILVDPTGKVLIFCGDTYVGRTMNNPPAVQGLGFTNTSLLWFDSGNFGAKYSEGTNIFGAPNPFVPGYILTVDPLTGGFRWPGGPWMNPDNVGDRVHAMYHGFDGNIFAGYTYARLDEVTFDKNMDHISITRVPGLDPYMLTNPATGISEVVSFGGAVVMHTDGFQYIFGTWNRTWDGTVLVVARRNAAYGSLPGNLPNFWNGSAWVSDKTQVVSLGPTPGQQISVYMHGSKWRCTSVRKGLYTNKVAVWTGSTPTGTWTDQGDVFTIPFEFTGQYNYGGLSYVPEPGKLRILYNLNGGTQNQDYHRYGVRWTEVDF